MRFKTKNLALTVVIIFSSSLFSQSSLLNEAFLQSLPSSLASQFSQASDETDDTNELQRPDTRITNLEDGIQDIRDSLTALEYDLIREKLGSEASDDLEIFGKNFFSSYQSTFYPISEPNFSDNYILDVGDILEIVATGKISTKSKVKVMRNGVVQIRDIGSVMVAGLTVSDAIKKIESFAAKRLIGVELFVSLREMRDMNILLIGNAQNPGMYTLQGGSTILSLLHMAGGISEKGSFRKIIHKRDNEIIQEIDLYDVLIKGNLRFKRPLRGGDVIIINPVGNLVSITGGINIPAIYELNEGETLSDLVSYALGYQHLASDNVQVRKSNGDEKTYTRTSPLELDSGDSIYVPLFKPENTSIFKVTIKGAVAKPGTYSISSGQTLSNLINEAGGYLENAYPFGGKLFRKSVADMQSMAFDRAYKDLITYVASASGSVTSTANLNSNLQLILSELKNNKPDGRLSAEFNLKKIAANQNLDTVLSDGDVIEIPYFSSEVVVLGDVQNPGGRAFVSGTDASSYISASGGFNKYADEKLVTVIQPDGNAYLVNSNWLFKSKQELYPGSMIYVPREIGAVEGINFAATLAPIVSSLAISLASLNSISND